MMHRRGFLKSSVIMAAAAGLSPHVFASADQAGGKRVGFVDYDLNNFHANVFLAALREGLADRGYEVTGAIALQEEPSRAWAEERGVPYFDDPAALDEHCDFYMVLAPSNPEVHLELCRWVVPQGKATYVDKTFAPDLATAKQIFELADEHDTPLQTASALRYTNVQEMLGEIEADEGPLQHITTWGGGGSYDEYAIHPLELAVSCLGHEAQTLLRRGEGNHVRLLIDFSEGRSAVVNLHMRSRTPYAASLTTDAATRYVPVDTGAIFENTTAAILDFFESGKEDVDRRQTLAIMAALDAGRQDAAREAPVPLRVSREGPDS